MQVQIKGATQDLRVSTVTLQPEDSNNMYSFHCSGCGKFIQQIGGRVSKIYPFYEPAKDVVTITPCPQCGLKYTFQTHDGYSSEKIRVILHPIKEVNYFYCVDSKHRVLEYTPQAIRTMDNVMHQAPFQTDCPDESCLRVYFIAEMI